MSEMTNGHDRRQWLQHVGLGLAGASLLPSCAEVGPPEGSAGLRPGQPGNQESPTSTTPEKPRAKAPDSLRARLELAIRHAFERDLAISNAFWTVFHGVLAFGPRCQLIDRRRAGQVSALDYMLAGQFERGPIRGLRFIPTPAGLDVGMGPTFVGQGHQDQFVAILAQWNIPHDRAVMVGQKKFQVLDFVHEIQAHVRLKQELSWSLIAIGWYKGTDASWTNRHGEKLTFDDLVEAELHAPIDTAACGGTHRLYGLTWALNMHRRQGGQTTGLWKKVDDHLQQHVHKAKKFQSADGSFSTNYFRTVGNDRDARERLNSSGHTLEWLVSALDDQHLRSAWIQRAVSAVSLMFLDIQSMPMESGALYHAAHGLVIYHQRVYQTDPAKLFQPKPAKSDPSAPTEIPPPPTAVDTLSSK